MCFAMFPYMCPDRKQIETLLDMLPGMYAENPHGEVAIGAVVKGMLSALVSHDNSSLVFQPPHSLTLVFHRGIKVVS